MIRLFLKLLALLPAAVPLLAVNYSIDPAHAFHSGCERTAAEELLQGKHVPLGISYDDWLINKHVVEHLEEAPELIVLGSSRGILIRGSQFSSSRFFNHSVSGAGLEEFLAIYQIYIVREIKPRWVILEVNPWLISKNFPRRPRVRFETDMERDYEKMSQSLNLRPRKNVMRSWQDARDRYSQLFSPAYFRWSTSLAIEWVVKGRVRRCDITRTHPVDSDRHFLMFPDGSVMYPQHILAMSSSEIRERTLREVSLAGTPRSAIRPVVPDPKAKTEFEVFLEFLQQDTVPVLLLVPLHPAIRESSALYSSIMESERYFKSIASRLQLTLVGSYDAVAAGCAQSEFIDTLHPSSSCVSRILESWRAWPSHPTRLSRPNGNLDGG